MITSNLVMIILQSMMITSYLTVITLYPATITSYLINDYFISYRPQLTHILSQLPHIYQNYLLLHHNYPSVHDDYLPYILSPAMITLYATTITSHIPQLFGI